MTSFQILFVSIAAVCVLAAIGVFAIAYRRSGGRAPSWRTGVDRETLQADKSGEVAIPVTVGAPAAEVEAAAEVETEVASAPVETAPAPVDVERPVAVQAVEVQRVVEVSPEEAGVTRRQFFNRALLGTFGAFAGGMGLAMLAFVWPKLSGGFGSDISIGGIEDARSSIFQPDGSVTPLFIPEARAYVVPVEEASLSSQFEGQSVAAGGLMAIFQRCVHLGCRVPWCQPSQGFECPCHGSKYNVIGEYESGPAPRNLDRFVVEDSDGDLIIKTSQVILTARAPVQSVPYPQGPSCIAIEAPAEEA